jgi:hypothetical protein
MAAEPLQVTIASKKIDGAWEAAVLSQGRFSRALKGNDLYSLVTGQLTALLSLDRPEGSEVSLQILITDGSVEKADGPAKA